MDLFIDNFRAFKNQHLPLSKVNILIGENSSGKSSLLKLLLAIKQSLNDPQASNLLLNDKLVNLGNYKESVYYHDEHLPVNLGFSFSGIEVQKIFKSFFPHLEPKSKLPECIKRSFEFSTDCSYVISKELDFHETLKTRISNESLGDISIIFPEEKEMTELNFSDNLSCSLVYRKKLGNKHKTYLIENLDYAKSAFLSIIAGGSLRNSCKKLDETEELFYEIGAMLLAQNLIQINLNDMKFCNPLDSNPQRFYIKNDIRNQYKKNDLEKFVLEGTKDTSALIKKFSKILKKFGIADDLKLKNSKDFPIAELRIQIKNLLSNILDVGYGVSLQIPILYEALLAEESGGRCLLLEQPEIHLHPKLQANFIDTLLSIGGQNQYIIETHSEHIVRKLQIMVKNKEYDLSSKDVNIYYFKRDKDRFNIQQNSINSNGQLEAPLPSGFFDTSYNLVKSLMFEV